MVKLKWLAGATALVVLTGCSSGQLGRTESAAAVGAVAGAVLGHQLDSDQGKFIGAAIGALAGASVGNYMDAQQRELEESLAAEQAAGEVDIERLQDETLKLSVSSEATFDFNSTTIKPAFRPALDRLSNTMNEYNKTVLHVVGHTDSTGPDAYNLDLSLRRSENVANYLRQRGVMAERLVVDGVGEAQPLESNATVSGRAANRRVEIFIRPVVQGRESEASVRPMS